MSSSQPRLEPRRLSLPPGEAGSSDASTDSSDGEGEEDVREGRTTPSRREDPDSKDSSSSEDSDPSSYDVSRNLTPADTEERDECDEDELLQLAEHLGCAVRRVGDMPQAVRWLVEKALSAPLPAGWTEAENEEGVPYFFNSGTQQTQWDHPLDEHFRARVAKAMEDVAATPPGRRRARTHREDTGASPSAPQTVSRAAILHALHLGMSPEEDQDLLWIAVQALSTPVQHPWLEATTEDGTAFYRNQETEEIVFTNPNDEIFRALYLRKKAERTPGKRRVKRTEEAGDPVDETDSDMDSDELATASLDDSADSEGSGHTPGKMSMQELRMFLGVSGGLGRRRRFGGRKGG